jgi:hypothetical protein
MDGRNLYAGPNLSGRESIDDPSTEWLRIPEDTVIDEVADAACNASYAWPLRAYAPAAPVLAEAAPPPPPAAEEQPVEEARTEPLPAPAAPTVAPAKAEIPRESSAPATRYAVQIGAYRNQALAETAWKALSTERPVLTEGHDFGVRPVKVKGKELLRGLVLNFSSAKEGRAFCTALAGTGYGCILRVLAD